MANRGLTSKRTGSEGREVAAVAILPTGRAEPSKFADLHLHTYFSDGTYSPEELAASAKNVGLGAVALTDHDTVDGCERMAAACSTLGIEFIPGSEITAQHDGVEVHILGYFIDSRNSELRSQLEASQAIRRARVLEMVSRLEAMGIRFTPEELVLISAARAPGRPHVAAALVRSGRCASVDDAFERFLKRNRPAWVPRQRIEAAIAIALIQAAGGVAVLAHPGLSRVDDSLPALIAVGLDGIECFHTKHSPSTVQYYLQLAQYHGLLITGGSDCHGMTKGRPLIGTVKLPYEHLAALKSAHARKAGTRT